MNNENKNMTGELIRQSSANAITYSGQVKIDLLKKHKVIKSWTQHNDAGEPMLDFLLTALRGELDMTHHPSYIKLFSKGSSNSTYTEKTAGIKYNEVSKIESVTATSPTVKSKIELHFTIPCTMISGSTSETTIDQARLYSSNNLTEVDNYSAKVNFSNSITIPANNGDYTLFISWSLILGYTDPTDSSSEN